MLLKPGQQTTLGSYIVRMDALKVTNDNQKQMITGHFTVFEGGREIAKMYPARWFFNKHEEPTTEVAIRRKFEEDLYLNMHNFQVADQSASLEITINPLVNWIWLGFAVMALGTGIVLLPERTFAFAMAKFPAPEVATTAGMFLLMFCLATPALAQHTEDGAPVAVRAVHAASSASCSARSSACAAPVDGKISRSAPAARPPKCARSSPGSSGTGRRETRSSSTTSRSTAARTALVANRQGLQPPGVVLPVCRRRIRRDGGRVRRAKVVAALTRRTGGTPVNTPPSAEDAALQARLDRELENLD